jgi:outer membrane receptor for ferrienterochelin and colicin
MDSTLLRKLVLTLSFLFAALAVRPAFADNLADEAELEFELGADRYKAGDFRPALEHFLASNRLVPNRNVVFNIARTYEQLKQSPDAYRYYTQALEGEKDQATRKRIEDALARVAPLVAVLDLETDPPGATIYVDRKELGARGNAPLKLGLPAGSYKVFAELPGYEPAEAPPIPVRVGVETPLRLKLKQILGMVRVEGEPPGALIRIDSEDAAPAGAVPATLSLVPGRHTLVVTKDGYLQTAIPINVPANETVTVHPKLAPIAGNLIVNSDVRDALVEIDGRGMGFTPAALNIPIGTHVVRVSLGGFRPYEQTVLVSASGQAKVDAQLTQIEEVTAASRVTENVEDAPSSVTIITGQELRAMGYPTIAEAVRGVRGVYLSYDTSYDSVGFRGFNRAGDYGSRVLVLLDGQPTNDDYVGQSYVGYDGRVDLADIERIEVVRGPGSVLYGTGAFFGVINLVTRNRGAPTHTELGASTSGNSVGTARAMQQIRFSPDAGVWTSVAGAHSTGRDYFFKEYASDPATHGWARNVDGFNAATVNGRAWYKSLTLQWFLTSRKKQLPSGEFVTLFGDGQTHFADTRGFLEAKFEPKIGRTIELLTRGHLNLYSFDDFLASTVENGGNATESFRGQWGGVEQRVAWIPIHEVRVTAGGEYQRHFSAYQTGLAAGGVSAGVYTPPSIYLNRGDPFSVAAGYLSGDFTPIPAIKLSAGSRLDYYTTFGSSFNPRVAVIVKPYERGNVKLMLGKAFRAPSVYEHYYQAPTQAPGCDSTVGPNLVCLSPLKPEQIYSGELEFSHRFSPTVTGTVAGYTNYITDLIALQGGGTTASPNQYMNISTPVQTYGAEVEFRREWREGWMVAAQYSYQHTQYLNNDGSLREVPNSPNHLASVKGAVPILGRVLMAMTRLSFEGPRYDKYDQSTDPPQQQTDPLFLWDLVLSGEVERYGVRYNLGLYNATDQRYYLPVSREFVQTNIEQNGRTLLAQASVSF